MSSRFSYANVMASIAVFVALGGASYAALSLPRNSVGSKQLRRNAVSSAKVRDHSLRAADFAPGQLPAGAAGPAGATGPAGPAGPKGDTGSYPTVLPSGQTEIGALAAEDNNTGGNAHAYAPISFPLPLASAPTPNVVSSGPTAQCPGSSSHPTAAPGNLCIYPFDSSSGPTIVLKVSDETLGADTFGALVFQSKAADAYLIGAWAVTAA